MSFAVYLRGSFFALVVFTGCYLSNFHAIADTFEFTTKVGYPTASASLENTPAETPLWNVTSRSEGPGFFVDGSAGYIWANPAGESASAVLTKPFALASGKTISIAMLFQFEGINTESQENILLPGIYLGTSPQFFQFACGVTLGHFSWSQSEYALQVHETGNGLAKFSGGDVGIFEAGKLSQKLRLTWSLSKGISPEDWSYEASLDNAETSTNIARLSGKASIPEAVFSAPALFLHLQRGSSQTSGGSARIRIHQMDVSITAN